MGALHRVPDAEHLFSVEPLNMRLPKGAVRLMAGLQPELLRVERPWHQ